jgi:hypothetical protein
MITAEPDLMIDQVCVQDRLRKSASWPCFQPVRQPEVAAA